MSTVVTIGLDLAKSVFQTMVLMMPAGLCCAGGYRGTS
jgi:hypothetical protein